MKWNCSPAVRATQHRFNDLIDPTCPFPTCRTTQTMQTQNHVLGPCPRFSPAHTSRHDRAVNLLARWCNGLEMDQVMINTSSRRDGLPLESLSILRAGGPTARLGLRPDIVLVKDRKVWIIELAITADDDKSLNSRRQRKIIEYQPLARAIDGGIYSCVGLIPVILGNRGRVPAIVIHQLRKITKSKEALSSLRETMKKISNAIFEHALKTMDMVRMSVDNYSTRSRL